MMDKHEKKRINEMLDMIVKIEARRALAEDMQLWEIEAGCAEDLKRRRAELRSLVG